MATDGHKLLVTLTMFGSGIILCTFLTGVTAVFSGSIVHYGFLLDIFNEQFVLTSSV